MDNGDLPTESRSPRLPQRRSVVTAVILALIVIAVVLVGALTTLGHRSHLSADRQANKPAAMTPSLLPTPTETHPPTNLCATNPTSMIMSLHNGAITWTWTGAKNAQAYDVFLYHLEGTQEIKDSFERTTTATFTIAHGDPARLRLKVHTEGGCSAKQSFFSPLLTVTPS